MNKKGSVVAIAFILGMVFFIAVSALLQHSSGEMKHVKAISAVKKAELLSISGIDWAESELRKGRWYGEEFVPYKRAEGKHKTFGVKKNLEPFGSGEGNVTIVCEDVANKTPGSNQYGMQQIWFLHHINVYALGTYDGQKCLTYGRYIISPEPKLNSKSTEGADFEQPENGEVGALGVFVKNTVNGEETSDFVVNEIKVITGDKVDVNSTIITLSPKANPDVTVSVKPSNTYGTVAEIKVKEGDTCKTGDCIAILKKSVTLGDTEVAQKTLKKMVRVTKIPKEVWEGLDIEDRNDRYALSQYISGLSDAYLQNFVAHASLEKKLKEIGREKFDDKLTSADILKEFPAHITSTTRNRAENTFLAYMIKNFTAPGGTWDTKEEALNNTILLLDQPQTTQPPADLVRDLEAHNLKYLLDTKPRTNRDYYEPTLHDDKFMELLKPHLNEPSSEFIKVLSELPDASRNCEFQGGEYDTAVNEEDENHILIVKPGSAGEEGIKVSVEKITKKYTFVDPVSNFSIEMNDLMNFIKKYYDDSESMSPREDVRKNENIDWPLPEPEPGPPADVPGKKWVWIPGTPGTPPGEPTYHNNGGSDRNIDPPTAGSGEFEPTSIGDPDGGSKEWEVKGEPGSDGGDSGGNQDPNESEEPGSIKVCNCCGGCCSKCNGTEPEKIKMNVGTEWTVKPGKAGTEPSKGHYELVEIPKAEDDGDDGDDGSDGSGHGGGNGTSDASDSDGGSGGSGGGYSGSPSGGSSSGGGSSAPSRSYSHSSGSY